MSFDPFPNDPGSSNPQPNPYKGTGVINLGVPRQPNIKRPTLIIASGSIIINTTGDDGIIFAYCDNTPNPAVEVAHARGLITGATGRIPFMLTFIVAAGDYYQFNSSANAGAPTVSVFETNEVTL